MYYHSLLESCLLSTYHTVAYSRTLYVKCEWTWTAALIVYIYIFIWILLPDIDVRNDIATIIEVLDDY